MDTLRYIWIIALFLFFSCKKDDPQMHKMIELEAYHTLQLNDAFEVELLEQEDFGLEIWGRESFVEKTSFSIQDCTLSIQNTKKLKWTDPKGNKLKLLIKGKGLKAVYANESCIISSLNPITTREFGIILGSKANTADIWVDNQVIYYWNNFPCGGKLTIRGNTRDLKLWNHAIMTVDASALDAEYGFVENYSKGDCTVKLSEYLEYKIDGEGDILLIGDPTLYNKGSASSGSLIKQ